MISAERARELFSYDPNTGQLARLTGPRRGPVRVTPRCDGYVAIHTEAGRLYAHRLAWLIATGNNPEVIDHIDGDRANNRLANLRSGSFSDNARNLSLRKDNRSGVTGVHRHSDGKKWVAQIKSAPKTTVHLGLFSTIEAAAAAIEDARERYGYHPNHGRRPSSVKHDGPSPMGGVA